MERKLLRTFFDPDDFSEWKKEWKGMPEFVQDDLEPVQQIIVSFATQEDVKEFSKVINQNLTYKTNSIWFPKVENFKSINYLYTDES